MGSIHYFLGFWNIFAWLMVMLISIALIKDTNGTSMGFKYSKSFESEENRIKINKYGAKMLIIWSTYILIIGTFSFFIKYKSDSALMALFSTPTLVIIIPLIQTYKYQKKL